MESFEFELEILFSGLCAFVPRRAGGKVWVLLIDQEYAEPDDYDDGTVPVPLHKSVIKWRLVDTYDPSPAQFPREAKGIWTLSEDDIWVLPVKNETDWNLTIEDFDVKTETASGAPKRNSFVWVAPLEEACSKRGYPHAGSIHPEFVADKIDFRNFRLAARFHLEEGDLKAIKIGKSGDKDVVWRFRPFKGEEAGGDHRQILATQVAYTRVIKGDYATVQAYTGDGGDAKARKTALQLRPTEREIEYAEREKRRPKVTIDVMNEEGEQIIGGREYQPKIKEPRLQDRVFELYSRFSPYAPPDYDMPVPVADYFRDGPRDAGAVSSPPCSPTRTRSV